MLSSVVSKSLTRPARLVQSATESERASLVEAVLDVARVDTSGLTKQQRFELAREKLADRLARYRHSFRWFVILWLGTAGLALAAFSIQRHSAPDVLQLRVTVLEPGGQPVDNSELRVVSASNESQRVDGGWEVVFPASAIPPDGRVEVYATRGSLTGSTTVDLLGSDVVAVTIQLEPPPEVLVRGEVRGPDDRLLAGAVVSVSGYGDEAVTTDETGIFVLPAHAGIGDSIRLHVEHPDYPPADQYALLSDVPETIIMDSPIP